MEAVRRTLSRTLDKIDEVSDEWLSSKADDVSKVIVQLAEEETYLQEPTFQELVMSRDGDDFQIRIVGHSPDGEEAWAQFSFPLTELLR